MQRVPPQVLLLATVSTWALSFTTTRFGVTHGFSPIVFGSLRWAIASVALLVFVLIRRQKLVFRKRDLVAVGLISLIGVGAQQVAFNYSLRLTQASTVALVFGLQPIFVSAVAHFSRVEEMKLRNWTAASLSLAGVVLVALGQGRISTSAAGLVLALVAAALFAGYSVAVQPFIRRNSPVVVTTVSAIGCASVLSLVGAPSLASQVWVSPSLLAWLAVAYTGLVPVAIGNVLWLSGMRRLGPASASLYLNLQPLLGAAYGMMLLSERLTLIQVLGALLIGTGILLGSDVLMRTAPNMSKLPDNASAEASQGSESSTTACSQRREP